MVKKVTISEGGEKKKEIVEVKSKVDRMIDMYPQPSFLPNCQFDNPVGKLRVLSWNMVGTIWLR